MLILHVHIMGRAGSVERTYDFLRNDGRESFQGVDVFIPYDDRNKYPISENDSLDLLATEEMKGDH